jgi:AcrR family transcriptional regulator
MSADVRPKRRSHAEIRAQTRDALLDAGVAVLAEHGYAGTTQAMVVARSGLSNGAMWRSFPTKTALMAAIAWRCNQQLDAWLEPSRFQRMAPERRVDAVVDRLLRMTCRPEMVASIELLNASRYDVDLARALGGQDRAAADSFFDLLAQALGAKIASRPDFRRQGRLLGLLLHGIALTEGLRAETRRRELYGDVRLLARSLLLESAVDLGVEQCS